MASYKNFLGSWGVFILLWGWACTVWPQTIGTITNRSYPTGASNAVVPLTLTGFQAQKVIRTTAANITSGNSQSYEGPGTRIFQGLKPDVVMIQEFNVGSKTTAEFRSWVDTTFGTDFSYFRESSGAIPNGVISRWPILQSGSWDDTTISDRGFAWAEIDIPGSKHLWVISVHLKASSGSSNSNQRQSQAQQLLSYIQAHVPADDYLLIGGDCNTYSYTESCLTTLGSVVDVSAPRPADQAGDPDTNAGRSSPYDWVMAEPELDTLEVPVQIGSLTFPNGLVFDSRVFSPLSLVSPVLSADSGASNMQHMAVVRDFQVDAPEMVTVQATSSNPSLLPAANIQVTGSGLSRSLQINTVAGQTGTATVTVTVSDGTVTDTKSFLVTAGTGQTSYAAWAGTNAVTNAEGIGKYAIGGATNLTAASEGPVSSISGSQLILSAIVRTNDPKLSVVGEAGASLTNWSTSGVSVTVSTNTNGVPDGCQRRVFSVDRTNSPAKQFLRLKATLNP